MVCNGAGILKALGLYQNDLELGGGVDVDHLVLLLGTLHRLFLCIVHANAETAVVVHHLGAVVDVLIVVIVLTAKKAFFETIHERHSICSFHSGSRSCLAPFAKEMQIAFTIIGFFAADVNNYKSFPSYKFCPETIISS